MQFFDEISLHLATLTSNFILVVMFLFLFVALVLTLDLARNAKKTNENAQKTIKLWLLSLLCLLLNIVVTALCIHTIEWTFIATIIIFIVVTIVIFLSIANKKK